MKDKTYHFRHISECNMCGARADKFTLLGKRLNTSQGVRPTKKIGIATSVLKCQECSLIFANPMPIPEKLEDHYKVPPENYWIPEYFQIAENYFEGETKHYEKLKKFIPGQKSLDIGAGIGKCMVILERKGFEAYGIEPSEPFYKRAIKQMNINPQRLTNCSIEEAEFPDNFFDFITFGAVLEHLYDPGGSIAKAMKWLKPEGLMHIEVPSSDWLVSKLANLYYKITATDYVGNISPMHTPFHLYEFTLKSFTDHGVLHNYKVADHCFYVATTCTPSFMNWLKPIMAKTNTGSQLCVWLKKN